MNITIENATLTATLDGVRYVNDFVTNITINDPRENSMSVSPQGGSRGVVFRTNTAQAVTADLTVRNLPNELAGVYQLAFATQQRLDFMIIDSRTGERYDLNEAIIRTNPINTTITEGEGSLDVALNITCPPVEFKYTGGDV